MTDENDLIRRGDALNILRDAIVASERCGDYCRPVVRAQICSCIERVWAAAYDDLPGGHELERVLQEAAFVHGAQSFREMIARFVEHGPPTDPKVLAGSIRANWVPGWGEDPGRLPASIPYNAFGETAETDKLFSEIAASADTLPQGQDAQQGLAGTESGAVPEGQTPNPSPSPAAGR